MTFDHPRMLLLLFIIVLVIVSMVLQYIKQQKVFSVFLQKYNEEKQSLWIQRLNFRYVVMSFFFIIFLACIIIALAGPRWGTTLVYEHRAGLDVVFAMDVSRSMDAQDAQPSRLLRSSLIACELVKASPGIRFGVAVGKGSGILAVPLTDDSEAVLGFLGGISTSTITSQGTNLENLIAAAASAFQDSFPAKRLIVLFSDGEAHAGNINPVLQKAKDNSIYIVSAALGLEDGSPIPLGSEMLRNPDGTMVISSLHPEPLRQAAERTGGLYVDGNRKDAFAILNNYLLSLSSESVSSGTRREPKSQWHLFIILGIAAYGLSRWVESGWRWNE